MVSNYRQKISSINREINQIEKKRIEICSRIEEKSSVASSLRSEIDSDSHGIHSSSEDSQKLRMLSSELVIQQEKLRQAQRQEDLIKDSVFNKEISKEETKRQQLEADIANLQEEVPVGRRFLTISG